jgi:hypothetical protein
MPLPARPLLQTALKVLVGILLSIPLILLLAYFITLAVQRGAMPAVPVLFAGLTLVLSLAPSLFELAYVKLLLVLACLTVFQFTTIYLDVNFAKEDYLYAWYSQSAVFLFLNGLLVSTCLLI